MGSVVPFQEMNVILLITVSAGIATQTNSSHHLPKKAARRAETCKNLLPQECRNSGNCEIRIRHGFRNFLLNGAHQIQRQ